MKIRKLEIPYYALKSNHVSHPAVLRILKTKVFNCHYNQHDPPPQLEDQTHNAIFCFFLSNLLIQPLLFPLTPLTSSTSAWVSTHYSSKQESEGYLLSPIWSPTSKHVLERGLGFPVNLQSIESTFFLKQFILLVFCTLISPIIFNFYSKTMLIITHYNDFTAPQFHVVGRDTIFSSWCHMVLLQRVNPMVQ